MHLYFPNVFSYYQGLFYLSSSKRFLTSSVSLRKKGGTLYLMYFLKKLFNHSFWKKHLSIVRELQCAEKISKEDPIMKLHPLLFFQLLPPLPAYLTQNEQLARCSALYSRRHKKECLNQKDKTCQHMSTNTTMVPSKSLNPRMQYIFSSMLAAHGNSTRGIKKTPTP